jgi:hypothetical protein
VEAKIQIHLVQEAKVDQLTCHIGGNEVPNIPERRKNSLGMVQPSFALALEGVEAVPVGPAAPMPEGSTPNGGA